MALVGSQVGVNVTVVVPTCTPAPKIERARSLGAEVIVEGEIYDESERAALELSESTGTPYISGFEDSGVIAGGSTVVPEILDQVGPPGTILVPVGGGGLISGITAALQTLSPQTAVVGVQPLASQPMALSFAAGRFVEADHRPTLSEGTAGGTSPELFEYLLPRVAEMVTVDEAEIARAIRALLIHDKVISEGAGALPAATLVARTDPVTWAQPVVALVSGGNIDPEILGGVLSG